MRKRLSRRSFLRTMGGTGLAFGLPGGLAGCGGSDSGAASRSGSGPVVFIAVDSLPPSYLTLNANGEKGGRDGDWLMPNVRRYLEGATLFADARCYLPSATDMNHLNAIAGTSSAETGVLGVSTQPYNWNPDGTVRMGNPSLSWVRDGAGRPVDTLFRAWKRRWPASTTAYVAGKFWVGRMHQTEGSGVDLIVTGEDYPGYIPPPERYDFLNPPVYEISGSDPASVWQAIANQLFLMRDPVHFPCDRWIVDTSLEILSRERPDLSVILLAQMDDTQHSFGSLSDPDDFVRCVLPICDYRSARNQMAYRGPILEAAKDVDKQFGRLIDGLRSMERYRNATVVLYSDHGHVNHVLKDFGGATDMVEILLREGVISEEEKKGVGFSPWGLTSMASVYWKGSSVEERQARALAARNVLLDYRVQNPVTGASECPWFVGAHEDMIRGVSGWAEPGELWHDYFGPNNDSESLVWPDLLVGMRNGWQIPAYANVLSDIGLKLPFPWPPVALFLGGHGGRDTDRIVMAVAGPGIEKGKTLADPGYAQNYRISDLAVTVAAMFGLELQSTTIGKDRSRDLA